MAQSKEQEALKAELKKLLKLPENARCADCNTQGPTWASTNLGVFICMRCSGIHRSLGTHISKVKSTVLDNWAPHMVARMGSVGNEVARLIYEHGVPKNYPRNFADQHQLVSWINNKYHYKKWFNESADPDLQGSDDESPQTPSIAAQPIPQHVGTHGSAIHGHSTQIPGRFVASAPNTPAAPEIDLFALNPGQQAGHHAGFAQFDAFGSDVFHSTPQNAQNGFASFPALAPPHTASAHTMSLPVTPTVQSPAPNADMGAFKGAATHNEPDLFSIPISAHGTAQSHDAASKPKPVDKSQLMSMYNTTPFGQQPQQPQFSASLQQHAFAAQQYQFQQQLLMNQPQNAFGMPQYSAQAQFAHPAGAQTQNMFGAFGTAPVASHGMHAAPHGFQAPAAASPTANAGSFPNNTQAWGTTSAQRNFAPGGSTTFAPTATAPSSNSSALASLYAATPPQNQAFGTNFNAFGASPTNSAFASAQPASLM
jgi:hypothetical protein